ncbi:MAG: peptide ABC transporter substrate-binding protein [Parachlamydiales bacterium]|nr:peptide ABC transporter substrate-binding protein [Parachlamydiales bacterium]
MKQYKFLITALLLLASSACQQSDHNIKNKHEEKVLKICAKDDPYSLDPRIGGDRASQVYIRLLYEGLMREGSDGKPHFAVAKDVKVSDDGLNYTFTLKDTQWSNGEPVTAFDFEYSWKKVIDHDFPSTSGYIMYLIKNAKAAKEGHCSIQDVGVKALDAKTLFVTLEHPAPYFLEMMTSGVYAPVCKSVAEKNPTGPLVADAVYNGPFILHDRKLKDFIEVVKNDKYWNCDEVKIDKIRFIISPNERTSLMLFERGEVDWVGDPLTKLPVNAIPQFRAAKKFNNFPSTSIFLYVFNVDRAPFNNPKMRRAFSYAIDRQAIVDNILKEGQCVETNFIPSSMGLHHSPCFKDHDVEMARKLFNESLVEMEMTVDQLPKMVLTIPDRHVMLAQAIQEQWRLTFGFTVEIETCEWNIYLDRLNERDYQIGCYAWSPNFNDPMGNLHYLKYKADVINDTGWEHPRFITLLESADHELNLLQRKEFLREAEELLLNEMPIAPLYTEAHGYLKKDYVTGVFASPLGEVDFREVDIKR